MEQVTLKAEPREAHGSRAAARLRRVGKVPGILYGHGETPLPVAVDRHDLEVLLHHGAHLVELRLDGGAEQAFIKEVQYDHLDATPVHVDFTRVSLDERVTVELPVDVRGEAPGLKQGGILDVTHSDLEVECPVADIPESLRIDISGLELGHSLHVRDVHFPPNVIPTLPPEVVICTIRVPVAAPAEEEEEAVPAPEPGAEEPEIIKREKKEEGENTEG
jgi:large subunit ribosomal protein L25